MSWYSGTLDFILDRTNSFVLGLVSFTEAIIQPIPPDLVYLPMLYDAMDNTPLVIWYFLITTVLWLGHTSAIYWENIGEDNYWIGL